MSIGVELTAGELVAVAGVGARRRINAIHRARANEFQAGDDRKWGIEINGAAAEYAVSKLLGIHWQGFAEGPSITHPDLAPNIEVRHTGRPDGGLIVYRDDSPNYIYVLVIGGDLSYKVVGYISGVDAQREVYWQGDGKLGKPAFLVKQEHLTPLNNAEELNKVRLFTVFPDAEELSPPSKQVARKAR